MTDEAVQVGAFTWVRKDMAVGIQARFDLPNRPTEIHCAVGNSAVSLYSTWEPHQVMKALGWTWGAT